MKTKEELIERDKDKSKPKPKDKIAVSRLVSFNNGLQHGVNIAFSELKQRVARLIKFHEDRIEELIKRYRKVWDEYNHYPVQTMDKIKKEYESLMAIEKEFEDVIC